MKRKTTNSMSLVYAYGCRAPLEGFDEVRKEVNLQIGFWNRLVSIERLYNRNVYVAAALSNPVLEVVSNYIDSLKEKKRNLIRQRKAIESKAVGDVVSLNLIIKAIKDTRSEIKETKKTIWKIFSIWRKSDPDGAKKIEDERKEAIKIARNDSGLYWGNYNGVVQDYETARKVVRKFGRHLQYHERIADWCAPESGILRIQIQKINGKNGAHFHELLDENVPSLKLSYVNDSRTGRRAGTKALASMRIDKNGTMINFPVTLHRRVPDGCLVKQAALSWKREGEEIIYKLCLTVDDPRPIVPNPSPSACGVDMGWRQRGDGSLLVATVATSKDDSIRSLELKENWVKMMDQVERLNSYIDKETNDLASNLDQLNLPEALLQPFRSKYVDVTDLHDTIRDMNFDVPVPVLHWYKRYRHLSVWRDNLRAKALRNRREEYLKFSKSLAENHSIVGIDKIYLQKAAKTKKRDDGSSPDLAKKARSNRQRACISSLREIVKHQAVKRGSQFIEITGVTTKKCNACGHKNKPVNKGDRVWECGKCGNIWDRDENASKNILAAAIASASVIRDAASM